MVSGASPGLNIVLETLLDPGDEVIVFAPYFVDYGNYVSNFDGKLMVVKPRKGGLPAHARCTGGGDHPRTRVLLS
jgi:aspartate aminotransferase